MEAIKKKIVIESENINIPELKNFIGKSMEIILIEAEDEDETKDNISKFLDLAGKIDIDEKEIDSLRERSKL
jgi:hypothetical protein